MKKTIKDFKIDKSYSNVTHQLQNIQSLIYHIKLFLADNHQIIKPTYMLTRKQTTEKLSDKPSVFKKGLSSDTIKKHLAGVQHTQSTVPLKLASKKIYDI